MDEMALITALAKGGPVAVALLALGFSVWKWILPAIQAVYETRSKIAAADHDRMEGSRKSRDEAWQAALKEIGVRHESAIHKLVEGHEKTLDRVISLARPDAKKE